MPVAKEYDTSEIDTEAITAMEKTPASCARFRILYMGYQLRLNVLQPDEATTQVVNSMNKLWNIHQSQCPQGKGIAAHLK